MFIKNISHLYKRKRFNNGYALVVGGYPRSGTTLLSEIIGRLTHYHFDRNNIFPNSGLFTWHTHWSPERLCGDKSIFIIRDPLEVAESLYYYSRYYGLQVQVPDLLTSSKLCRLGWISYYKSIIRNNGRLITYQDLISNDSKAIKNISEFCHVSDDHVGCALDIVQYNYYHNKIFIDHELNDAKSRMELPSGFIDVFSNEIEFYNDL